MPEGEGGPPCPAPELQAGDPAASVEIAQLIRDYQQSEGVRLKNVPGAYRVS